VWTSLVHLSQGKKRFLEIVLGDNRSDRGPRTIAPLTMRLCAAVSRQDNQHVTNRWLELHPENRIAMLHQGTRTYGGDLPGDKARKVAALLDEFVAFVATKLQAGQFRRAMVRSMLTCSTFTVLDSRHLFVAAQKQLGMPSSLALHHPEKEFSVQQVFDAARWEIGLDDPFVIQFPADCLDRSPDERRSIIESIGDGHIRSEISRVEREMNIVQINPAFGPASCALADDQRLAVRRACIARDFWRAGGIRVCWRRYSAAATRRKIGFVLLSYRGLKPTATGESPLRGCRGSGLWPRNRGRSLGMRAMAPRPQAVFLGRFAARPMVRLA
jgi:hypothetical protein